MSSRNALHGDPFFCKRRARRVEVIAEFHIDVRDDALVDFSTGPPGEAFEELFRRNEEAGDGRFEVRRRRRARVSGLCARRHAGRSVSPVLSVSLSGDLETKESKRVTRKSEIPRLTL